MGCRRPTGGNSQPQHDNRQDHRNRWTQEMSSLVAIRRSLRMCGPVRSTIGGNRNHQHHKEPADRTPTLAQNNARVELGDEQPPSINREQRGNKAHSHQRQRMRHEHADSDTRPQCPYQPRSQHSCIAGLHGPWQCSDAQPGHTHQVCHVGIL